MAFTNYSAPVTLQAFVREFFIFEHYAEPLQGSKKIVPPNDLPLLLFQFAELKSVCEDDKGNQRNPHRCGLVGQQTKPHYITHLGNIGVLGVHLQPSGIFQLLARPASRFANKSTDLSLMLDGTKEHCEKLAITADNAEKIRLTENYLLNRLKVLDVSLSVLRQEIATNDTTRWMSVSEIAASLGISVKQLQRKFGEEIGLSPRAYRKLARFNRLVNKLEFRLPDDWQQLIYESGYFDQAHMIRDFKFYTGKTPTTFLKDEEKFSFLPFICD